ncbi:branched-chain amino acid ABC transporter permease [Bosea sp. (in: a-proteobacteria)]|uniref:branched-chain amino acid ABC transporter permease n=1 Tax=Bosea sp. (in: a-proteobacteria) TaxID=1871050 RepID=UPI00260C07C1|nr:branched-chain amino acid ABC transporter permease [Bosea sp. (in: a-proteobacteria)]MCO5089603.1 branched-chain amino acid ABC transporter permease [Bosea sp. (in: a-proteobacteria)]
MPDASSRKPAFGRATALVLVAAALVALPFAVQALGQPALVTLATRVLIYAIAAASLNLALGYGGMISFGHAAFFGIGGYVVAILYRTLMDDGLFLGFIPGTDQLLITLPAAILAGGLVACVIGALSLRTSGVQFIMITLAFAQMLFFLFVSLKAYGGDDGLTIRRRNALFGLDTRDDITFYFICLAATALVFLALWRIVGSRFGMVLAGIRQNERRMAAIGIAPYRYKLAAFVISGMGCGLAGALMANYLRFVSPDMLHWTKSGELMIMVILGGVGTLIGPLLGAAALVVLETVLTGWTEHWQLVLGPILLLVVLFTRGGLSGLIARRAP